MMLIIPPFTPVGGEDGNRSGFFIETNQKYRNTTDQCMAVIFYCYILNSNVLLEIPTMPRWKIVVHIKGKLSYIRSSHVLCGKDSKNAENCLFEG
jgi:hypothetical protein